MTAPTEQEIREAVQKQLDVLIAEDGTNTPDWIAAVLTPLRYNPPSMDYNPSLWADLRPSQEARLEALEEEVFRKADALMLEVAARLAEAVVEAALTFAAEYPDAPRAKEAVPA